MEACAFQGLTEIILPFTTPSQSPPIIPENVINMLKVSQPDVLILSAGLALEDIKGIKSLKGIVVVDISSEPHMEWEEEFGNTHVQTWTDLIAAAGPSEADDAKPAAIAFQCFITTGDTYKTVNFTHQVMRPWGY